MDNEREKLTDYEARLKSMYDYDFEQTLQTADGLREKVTDDGEICPFWGDTVVFKFPEDIQSILSQLQKKLYDICGDILAEPLHSRFFHMTLHDLDHVFGCDKRWDNTCSRVKEILNDFDDGEISLRPVRVFSMARTSIVIGYIPADNRSFDLLMDWYEAFEKADLFPISYHPTFHITMAYYRPGCHDTRPLSDALACMQDEQLPSLTLKKKDLEYWRFKDMNNYFAV